MSINKILDLAIERNASDIHITVGYPVMIRVDGSLLALHEQILSSENAEELVFPLLSEQKKELLEVNREIDFAHTHRHGGEARFRINAYYTMQNLAAALRLIPTRIRTIEELNLPPIYTQFAGLKQGLVLVTGPTGHGKSTTLAAILQHVNVNRSAHMLTIEDPIEYVFPKSRAVVDQREMHDDTHSWAVALKSALRQDPDVILVGEMRDYETIAATITLAETGHLVFATLHTNSAAQTIDRIIDVFPENQQGQVRAQLANILEAVVAQRLIPIDGGGRRAVSEIMIGSTAVKNLIREGKTHQLDNVIRTSADIGMISLEHSLVKLVREGLITMDKAQEYAVHPEEVVRLLKS
ncbi:MAG TPA: type IV pilus twitching motility protein PilT [Candidatus Dojkabacteria bacterium]|nr:type IV pilus twitching motility protein PilT [Candidatus Dojkabacteria bacterium]